MAGKCPVVYSRIGSPILEAKKFVLKDEDRHRRSQNPSDFKFVRWDQNRPAVGYIEVFLCISSRTIQGQSLFGRRFYKDANRNSESTNILYSKFRRRVLAVAAFQESNSEARCSFHNTSECGHTNGIQGNR